MKRLLGLAILLALPASAAAQTCTLSATGVAFGLLVSGTAASITGTVTPNCTPSGTAYTVDLGAGTSSGASTTTRMMVNGANTIAYALSKDPAHSMNWGDNIDMTGVGATSTGADQPLTIYALAPSLPALTTPGTYTDMVTALVHVGAAVEAMATITISATVAPSCIISTSPLTFGAFTGVAKVSTTTVTVTCTNSTSYNVGLNPGTAPGATVTTRAMTSSSGATLAYGLYQDAGDTMNWGQTVGTDTVAGVGTGAAQSIIVHGMIPAGQFVTPGSYSDTITVTVTY